MPVEIQSTLSNVYYPVLAEIIKVISYLEKEMETVLTQNKKGYVGKKNLTQVFGISYHQI